MDNKEGDSFFYQDRGSKDSVFFWCKWTFSHDLEKLSVFHLENQAVRSFKSEFGRLVVCFEKPCALQRVAKGNNSTFVLPLFYSLWPSNKATRFHGW
jgi:hypothetical protein